MKYKVFSNVRQWVSNFLYFLDSIEGEDIKYPIWVGLNPTITQESIYYNTEQLTRKNILNNIVNISKNKNVIEIWDYSLENIKILNNKNIFNVKHVPLESPDWYIQKLKSFQPSEYKYDVGFCGSISKRRIKIINEIRKAGKKVNIIYGKWNDERDKELAKCKIIINIHYEDDYKVFESCRCEPWLKVGVPVISEKSLDDDSRCIIAEYDSLVKTTLEYLNKNNI